MSELIKQDEGDESETIGVKSHVSKKKELRIAIKDWIQIVALFIAAGWAVYTFYYEKVYEPKHSPPFMTMTGEIQKISENNNYAFFKIKITLRNDSKTVQLIPAAWFQVFGLRIKTADYGADSGYLKTTVGKCRYIYNKHTDLVSWNTIISENSGLESNQTIYQSNMLVVPKNEYQALNLRCTIVTANDNIFKPIWITMADSIAIKLVKAEPTKDTLSYEQLFNANIPERFDKYNVAFLQTSDDYPLELPKGDSTAKVQTGLKVQRSVIKSKK